jgi:hypothetical protein
MPDMAIAASLTALLPSLHLQFVLYSSGADAYRAGDEALDLHQHRQSSTLTLGEQSIGHCQEGSL